MVIDIPVSVDIGLIEEVIAHDAQRKVSVRINEMVEQAVKEIILKEGYADRHYSKLTPFQQYVKDCLDVAFRNAVCSWADDLIASKEDDLVEGVCGRISQKIMNRKKLKEAVTITIQGAGIDVE